MGSQIEKEKKKAGKKKARRIRTGLNVNSEESAAYFAVGVAGVGAGVAVVVRGGVAVETEGVLGVGLLGVVVACCPSVAGCTVAEAAGWFCSVGVVADWAAGAVSVAAGAGALTGALSNKLFVLCFAAP